RLRWTDIHLKHLGPAQQPHRRTLAIDAVEVGNLARRSNRPAQPGLRGVGANETECLRVDPGAAGIERSIGDDWLERDDVRVVAVDALATLQRVAVGFRQRDRERRSADALRLEERQAWNLALGSREIEAVHLDALLRHGRLARAG